MEQCAVYLARFPYTNMIDYKIRPTAIISNHEFNNSHNYYLCCPITSQESKTNQIELTKNNFNGELKVRSFIRTDSIAGMEKDLFLKKIGSISHQLLGELKMELWKNI